MQSMKAIQIDTETNALIEANRLSFEETQNEIIKRCLPANSNDKILEPANGPQPETSSKPKKQTRVSGTYDFDLLGKSYHESSLRAAYISILRRLQSNDPDFFQRLSLEETPGRRLISIEPTRLYKRSPELAKDHAEKIDSNWYIDLNLSEPQVIQRLKIACRVAQIKFGTELKLQFG